jgi:hypothetical protein
LCASALPRARDGRRGAAATSFLKRRLAAPGSLEARPVFVRKRAAARA